MFLGLARKAGAIGAGDTVVSECLRSGRAKVVVIANDASPRLRDKLLRAAEEQNTPVVRGPDRERLGHAVGMRPVAVVAVTDENLAQAITGSRPKEVGPDRATGGEYHAE